MSDIKDRSNLCHNQNRITMPYFPEDHDAVPKHSDKRSVTAGRLHHNSLKTDLQHHNYYVNWTMKFLNEK